MECRFKRADTQAVPQGFILQHPQKLFRESLFLLRTQITADAILHQILHPRCPQGHHRSPGCHGLQDHDSLGLRLGGEHKAVRRRHMGRNLPVGQASQEADLLTNVKLFTQIHILFLLRAVSDDHQPKIRQILFQTGHAPQQEGHILFMSQAGYRDQQGHLSVAILLSNGPHCPGIRLVTLQGQTRGQHGQICLTVVSITILGTENPLHSLRGSDDGVTAPHKAAEIPGGQFLFNGLAAPTAKTSQQIVFCRSLAQPVDETRIVQILLILGVVCIYQRDIVLLGQTGRHSADEHRVMYMNHIERFPGKCFLQHRVQGIGQHGVTVKMLTQGAVAHHILLRLLFVPQMLIFGGEYHHPVSLLPQRLRQTLNGDGNSSDIRFIVVGHHGYFHIYPPVLQRTLQSIFVRRLQTSPTPAPRKNIPHPQKADSRERFRSWSRPHTG